MADSTDSSDSSTTDWEPDQYARFAAERRLPFDELVQLCRPVPGGRVYDLGCGPGNLTAELVDRLHADVVIGVDSSPAMLAEAESIAHPRLRFEHGDLEAFHPEEPADIVLANASLQWADDHRAVMQQWRDGLTTNGQLAFQVPTNHDHPVYRIAAGLAEELDDWFEDGAPVPVVSSVLPPERYAELLHQMGGADIHVALRVYCHELDSTIGAAEWIKGTSLLRYKNALSAERYEEYETQFRRRLVDELGAQSPYLFTFKRILAWARFP